MVGDGSVTMGSVTPGTPGCSTARKHSGGQPRTRHTRCPVQVWPLPPLPPGLGSLLLPTVTGCTWTPPGSGCAARTRGRVTYPPPCALIQGELYKLRDLPGQGS